MTASRSAVLALLSLVALFGCLLGARERRVRTGEENID